MNTICCIDTCGYAAREESERNFHRFPLENKPLLDSWLKAIGAHKNFRPTLNTFICSNHFTANDYVLENGIFELSQDAVPSKIKNERIEIIDENVESSTNTNDELGHCVSVESPLYNIVNNEQANLNDDTYSPIITKVQGNYSSNLLTETSRNEVSNNSSFNGSRCVKIINAVDAANTNSTSGAKKIQKVILIQKASPRIVTNINKTQNELSSNLQLIKNLEYNNNKASTSKNTCSVSPLVMSKLRISNPMAPSTSTNQNIEGHSSDLRLGEKLHDKKRPPPFIPMNFPVNTLKPLTVYNSDGPIKNKIVVIKKNTSKNTQTETNDLWVLNKSNTQFRDKISDRCLLRMRKLARQNKRLTSKLNELTTVKEEFLDMQIKYMELKAKVLETEEKLLKSGIDTSEYSAFCLAVDSHDNIRYDIAMEELIRIPPTNCNSTTTTNAQTLTENKNVHQNMMEC